MRYLFAFFLFSSFFLGDVLALIEVTPIEIAASYDARGDEVYKDQVFLNDRSSDDLAAEGIVVTSAAEESIENTHLSIPLDLSIYLEELKAFQVGASLILPLEGPGKGDEIQVKLNYGDLSYEELPLPDNFNGGLKSIDSHTQGFLQPSPFSLESQDTLIFRQLEPQDQSQIFHFTLDLNIPPDLLPGTYEGSIKFSLYDGEEAFPIEEIEVPIRLEVAAFVLLQTKIIEANEEELDFGLIGAGVSRKDKDVEIKVITNLGVPYRLYQRRSLEFKTKQTEIDLAPKTLLYEINQEGILGTLYDEGARELTHEDLLLYESNASGDSDLLEMKYSFQNNEKVKAGLYEGNLTFFLEGTSGDSSLPKVDLVINLSLEVEQYFTFEYFPEEDAFNLDFSPLNHEDPYKDRILKMVVWSNTGRPWRLYQFLDNSLLSPDGGEIPLEEVQYGLCNEDGDLLEDERLPLQTSHDLVMESNEAGDSKAFFIKYFVLKKTEHMSGDYRSNLHFLLTDD